MTTHSEKKEIRVALAGLGNCASALIQGVEYYKNIESEDLYIKGIMNPSIGGYLPRHIKIVAAFDVATTKLNKDISEAIYADPNCCQKIVRLEDMPKNGRRLSIEYDFGSSRCSNHIKHMSNRSGWSLFQ